MRTKLREGDRPERELYCIIIIPLMCSDCHYYVKFAIVPYIISFHREKLYYKCSHVYIHVQ